MTLAADHALGPRFTGLQTAGAVGSAEAAARVGDDPANLASLAAVVQRFDDHVHPYTSRNRAPLRRAELIEDIAVEAPKDRGSIAAEGQRFALIDSQRTWLRAQRPILPHRRQTQKQNHDCVSHVRRIAPECLA